MAARAAVEERRRYAHEQLLLGRSTTSIVSELSEWPGVSSRLAQMAVKAAYERMVADVVGSGVDRPAMAAKIGHLLELSIAKAVQQNNYGAVASLASRLMDLYSLTPQASAGAYGTRGRSRVG